MFERFKLYWIWLMLIFWLPVLFPAISFELLPSSRALIPLLGLVSEGLLVLLCIATLRDRLDWIMIGSFALIAAITTLLNHMPLVTTLNGVREFLGLLCLPPIIRWFLAKDRPRFLGYLQKFAKWFLILNGSLIMIQFVLHGANDAAGGLWGLGGTGLASTTQYVASYFLMMRYRDPAKNYLTNLRDNKWLVIALLPTFFNETKVSFLYFMLYFILIMPMGLQTLRKMLLSLPLLVAVTVGVGYVYLQATGQDGNEVFSEEYMDFYFTGGEDTDHLIELAQVYELDQHMDTQGWAVDLPRLSKIYLAPAVLRTTTGGEMFGAGLGHFKGYTMMKPTPFAMEYNWLLEGTRPWSFSMLISMGWMGILWLALWAVCVMSPRRRSLNELRLSADIYFVCILVIIMFYSDFLRVADLVFILLLPVVCPCSQRPGNEPGTGGAPGSTTPTNP